MEKQEGERRELRQDVDVLSGDIVEINVLALQVQDCVRDPETIQIHKRYAETVPVPEL